MGVLTAVYSVGVLVRSIRSRHSMVVIRHNSRSSSLASDSATNNDSTLDDDDEDGCYDDETKDAENARNESDKAIPLRRKLTNFIGQLYWSIIGDYLVLATETIRFTVKGSQATSGRLAGLFSAASLLVLLFVLCQNILFQLPNILSCDDEPKAMIINDNYRVFDSFNRCNIQVKHYCLITPVIVILIIFSTVSHFTMFARLFLSFIYFALLWILHNFSNTFSSTSSSSPITSESLIIAMFFIMLFYARERNREMSSRSHHLWKAALRVEQEDVETYGGINKILLENILPQHVAQHFLLNTGRAPGVSGTLYHERYTSVAVMFASIPNYTEFYDENDVNKQGLECLRLLNEIICDFDKLLLKPKFSCVEKIKTIGSTYMAAAGLQPGRESFEGNTEGCFKMHREEHNVISLVDLAIALNNVLNQINRESFQRFRLRVGSKANYFWRLFVLLQHYQTFILSFFSS